MRLRVREMPPTLAVCPRQHAHRAALGGRILATIRGALGTEVLAGRHGLLVCGCSLVGAALAPIGAVWTYDRLVRLSAEQTGLLWVLDLTIRGRVDALPLIALDRDQVAAALVAIDRVQHLIDADNAARRDAAAVPAQRRAPVTALVAVER